jgi:hypothetical protein
MSERRAGRKLDIEVAEKVLGWHKAKSMSVVPNYSTSDCTALLIVSSPFWNDPPTLPRKFAAERSTSGTWGVAFGDYPAASASTFALAVCGAAIIAADARAVSEAETAVL